MVASPFSISTLMAAGLLLAIMILASYTMIQQAYTPPSANTNNATATHINCIPKGQPGNNTPENNAICLVQLAYGQNYSGGPNSYYGNVFSLINTVSFGGATATNNSNGGGFNANLFVSSVLAFVFPGIGQIITVVETLGSSFGTLMGALFSFLPNPMSLAIQGIVTVLISYVELRLIFGGISAWMKMDLWSF